MLSPNLSVNSNGRRSFIRNDSSQWQIGHFEHMKTEPYIQQRKSTNFNHLGGKLHTRNTKSFRNLTPEPFHKER